MEREKKNLKMLKEKYLEIQKKYNLPSFKELNEDFSIEKIVEIETDILIREVRKFIAEKLSNYLRFVEMVLHPVNAPIFVFSIIKSVGIEERKKLEDIYKRLAKNEIRMIETDIEFSEEKEADFIINSYKMWQGVKKELLDIFDKIKKNWDNKFEVNNKGYFG